MMRVYIAGVPGGGQPGICQREKELASLWSSRLYSYFHLIETGGEIVKQNKIELFLDSGAFSAWTRGAKIDIHEYVDFIKQHEEAIDVYANLDVIGDASATYKNQKIMEKAGLHPIPVFHQGEPEKYLERYTKKYDYIAIGGLVGISSHALVRWLERMWDSYLTDSEGLPIVKVHGFGLTSLRLMFRYPWYSVDSTSWVVTGRLGGIFVPRYRNGQWIYDENSWKIDVSNKSPSNKKAGKHITTLTPRQKEIFLHYIHAQGYELGKSIFKRELQSYKLNENERWAEKTPEDKTALRDVEVIQEVGICNSYKQRDEMNIKYFLEVEKEMPDWPWKFKSTYARSFIL